MADSHSAKSLWQDGGNNMCLGIPGKIVEVYEIDGTRMGKVDCRKCKLTHVTSVSFAPSRRVVAGI